MGDGKFGIREVSKCQMTLGFAGAGGEIYIYIYVCMYIYIFFFSIIYFSF